MNEDLKNLLGAVVVGGLIYYFLKNNEKSITNTPPVVNPVTPSLPPGVVPGTPLETLPTPSTNFVNMASTPVQDGSGGFFSSQKVKLNY